MINNTSILLCQHIITSKEKNLVNYINVIERITIGGKLPIRVAPLAMGTVWQKEVNNDEEIDFKIRVYVDSPSKKKNRIIETKVIKMKGLTHKVNFLMDGFEVTEEGDYKFILESSENGSDFQYVGEIYFPVLLKK
ncbi:MAG: hypothetical protein KAS92_09375 [Candidatus Omnitrophica bacterium]|nr:hypothetical protein [Candidatus Omnitrophota bacterium]